METLEMMAMEDFFERPGWKGKDRKAIEENWELLRDLWIRKGLRCFGTRGGDRQSWYLE